MLGQTFTEPNYTGDWLKGELKDILYYCRESVTILAGSDLPTGTVLGKITASGVYKEFDPDATDGSSTAVAILIFDVTSASDADEEEVAVLVRGPAQVYASKLNWVDNADTGDKLAAMTALKALGILSVLEA